MLTTAISGALYGLLRFLGFHPSVTQMAVVWVVVKIFVVLGGVLTAMWITKRRQRSKLDPGGPSGGPSRPST